MCTPSPLTSTEEGIGGAIAGIHTYVNNKIVEYLDALGVQYLVILFFLW
jgi:hypothetical protein